VKHSPDNPWVALVTFERSIVDDSYPDTLSVLEEGLLGAGGWMAVDAASEDDAKDELVRMLKEIGLKVVQIDDLEEIFELDQYKEFDEHLWKNVLEWEEGHLTVWGTLHGYYAEGEA
jgi:predicted hydrocarbon binding protein